MRIIGISTDLTFFDNPVAIEDVSLIAVSVSELEDIIVAIGYTQSELAGNDEQIDFIARLKALEDQLRRPHAIILELRKQTEGGSEDTAES